MTQSDIFHSDFVLEAEKAILVFDSLKKIA